MAPIEIPYGLRRYPFAVSLLGGGGLGFFYWSAHVNAPTFVFPLGRLDPPTARVVLAADGVAALLYVAAITFVRFVRRPVVRLAPDEITLPVGEFGGSTLTIRRGDVLAVTESGPRLGGWMTCHVRHRGGQHDIPSSQLPSDADFHRVVEHVQGLAG